MPRQATRDGKGKPFVSQHSEAAERLLANPDFQTFFDLTRNLIIGDLERTQLDGSPQTNDVALEHVRKLQTLLSLKRAMVTTLASAKQSIAVAAKKG